MYWPLMPVYHLQALVQLHLWLLLLLLLLLAQFSLACSELSCKCNNFPQVLGHVCSSIRKA
jgi:hypothetical protein